MLLGNNFRNNDCAFFHGLSQGYLKAEKHVESETEREMSTNRRGQLHAATEVRCSIIGWSGRRTPRSVGEKEG